MRALETFATPAELRKQGYPNKLDPLFRDDDEAGVHDTLSAQLQEALTNSKVLIVICTPRTKESAWVRREVEFFRSLGRANRIIPVIAEGDSNESIPEYLLSTDPDKTGWESDQALAVDLRPQQHEKPAVTFRRGVLRIAAAILECRYDDLAQRAEAERRQRRMRMAAGGAAALAVALIGLGFLWDAFLRTKYEYYANYSDRWGVPAGVGRLTSDVQRHRETSYQIATRGGRVVAMAHVNGRGARRAGVGSDQLDEPWGENVAEWRYIYRNDGLLSAAVALDITGRELRRLSYDFSADRRTAVVRIDAGVGRTETFLGDSASRLLVDDDAYDRVGGRLSVQRSSVGQHRLTFDETGLLVRRLFEPLGGGPLVADANGIAGRAYAHDGNGLTTEIRNLGLDGQPDNTPGKVAIIAMTHLPNGHTTATEYRGANGLLIADPDGVARATFEHDRYGNVITVSNFDANGAAVLFGDWGWARLELSYDQHGNQVESRVFGADGAPIHAGAERAAIIRNVYDHRGYAVEQSYFDIDGSPILARNSGAATLRWRYDAHGRVLEETALGLDRQPIRTFNGHAIARYAYDARGNEIEVALFDEQGRPTLGVNYGCAIRRTEYDEQNRQIRTRCFGIDGQPTLDNIGAHGSRTLYDARGNVSEYSYVDVQDASMIASGAWATARPRFDDAGRLVEVSYFSETGAPAVSDVGAAIIRVQYDAYGRATQKSFFGPDGRPVLQREQRIHAVQWRYNAQGAIEAEINIGLSGEILRVDRANRNARGRLIEASIWDGAGAPIVSAELSDAHLIRMTHDHRGNLIETALFDISGRPMTPALIRSQFSPRGDLIRNSVFAADGALMGGEVRRYDARGNRIETTILGPDGQPMLGPDGWAIERVRYDTLDRPIERLYFGAAGRLTIANEGVAGLRFGYDARGYLAEETLVGLDSRTMADPETGIAITRFRNDARGNVIEERRFGVDGALRESEEDGYAIERLTYESRGALIESNVLDARERPIEGLSTIRYQRDAFGRVTEMSYFGPTRRPTTNYAGVAVKRFRYDAAGTCAAVSTHNLNGALIEDRPVRFESECDL